MADVVLSTVDLDVFGGPSTVNLSLDVGATGERGSRIWAGPGGFATDLVGQDVNLYDIYINTTTGYMYQYTIQLGSPSWVFLKELASGANEYNNRVATTYDSDGYAIILYSPVPSGATVSDYVVNYNIRNATQSIATSHDLVISSGTLYIVIKASKLSGGVWSNLTGNWYTDLRVFYKGVTP
jgi:hypothetical protein